MISQRQRTFPFMSVGLDDADAHHAIEAERPVIDWWD
jgi:hypothetical protein